ncbi:transcription termination/antitermination protein NusG [Poseidonibacter ostreae]|jgi:transcription termination/antitermination protein NusG|uniref:Transcription termination/antitermination protein NusG n=1 Tax=Poseidonibacter ostreae TaxID=2654171 RepID=A0A6L4WSL7_9BACT|nr:transcription termination/antitermination protein NusG [Poseidonibacter ostreae]KAB7886260.1 transcription termination/antitermination protein NusG [Poseidonibacter ostreae]KAB7888909.1 transcription termination/antitermination protein NusG [Poseidonibacter ostreae]KAB7889344.1 transcription termination/antitermination protein NusG [Poseidonibacter ostreae]|tara:strand:+ start:444 stop:971 length:528 start_codon:yes stop_codon:yes gene_type:complete
MAHKWYAIQTYSGSELAVKRALIQLSEEMADGRIAEVLVPTEDLIEIKKGKKSIVERPLYPAYAFAKIELDTELWHGIQAMPKVGRFIGESKKPTPLSEKDITAILDKVNNRAAAKPKVSFDEGEMVRVNEGPFANFNGIVEDFDMASGMLKLNVSIFGRNTPVEISYSQVERVV